MTKEQIIKASISYIEKYAEEHNLEVIDNGTGHGFDNTVWKDVLTDDSNIPSISAKNEMYSISLSSFWGSPEICIREETEFGQVLMVLNYSDHVKDNDNNNDKKYKSTGDYEVNQVRVDGLHGNGYGYYLERMDEIVVYVNNFKE